MGWNYVFLVNLMSAAGLSIIYLTHDYLPWYLRTILFLNIVLSAVSSLIMDCKNSQRDERIEQLEKELRELQKKEIEND